MLQIDHIYEFFFQHLFSDFGFCYPRGGVLKDSPLDKFDITIFTRNEYPKFKIFFHDQEPVSEILSSPYFDQFDLAEITAVLVSSEHSSQLQSICHKRNYHHLYYFFHGFAALDWYRGYQSLNFSQSVVKKYSHDFISYNRLISHDRSYRIFFVSNLIEQDLLHRGLVSFNVSEQSDSPMIEINNHNTKLSEQAQKHIIQHLGRIGKQLIIDGSSVPGTSSADIPRTIDRIDYNNNRLDVDAFWHVVTETVFYYDKKHLTEKIFKPIVSKQAFMLLAAPGNLEYLRSYGFKTFDSVIDESYDRETNNDLRIQKVVNQLKWYCSLTQQQKTEVQKELEPIIQHNFNHFYSDFKHIITKELLSNCRGLFKQIGYNDSAIAYKDLHRVITN